MTLRMPYNSQMTGKMPQMKVVRNRKILFLWRNGPQAPPRHLNNLTAPTSPQTGPIPPIPHHKDHKQTTKEPIGPIAAKGQIQTCSVAVNYYIWKSAYFVSLHGS